MKNVDHKSYSIKTVAEKCNVLHVHMLLQIFTSSVQIKLQFPTHPKAKGRLFPVPKGTVAIGGG